jgi:D-alanyl-D-alanine dipeptidase
MLKKSRELDPDASSVALITLSLVSVGIIMFAPNLINSQKFLTLGMSQTKSIPTNLFATVNPKQSLGVRAICVAEGNCTLTGDRTKFSQGHKDPGNGKWNRGWCSDQGRGINESDADQKCLDYAKQWLSKNQDAANISSELFINAIDLANQSSIKSGLANKYREAIAAGKTGLEAIIHARVESFRVNGTLQASGLFRICEQSSRLSEFASYSESWRYQCIYRDQERRSKAIHAVLQLEK